ECGEGDALVTRDSGLALSVVTADCVPVLLAGPAGLAPLHAGGRGVAGGVVPATVAELGGPLSGWTAWIGPSIGPCCYEVGNDGAAQGGGASSAGGVLAGPAGRPHLDLQAAVRRQLAAGGVTDVRVVA